MNLNLTWMRTRRLARKTKVRLNPSSSSKDKARQPFSVHSSTAAERSRKATTFSHQHNHLVLSGGPTSITSQICAFYSHLYTTHQEDRSPLQSSELTYKEEKPLILLGISLCPYIDIRTTSLVSRAELHKQVENLINQQCE